MMVAKLAMGHEMSDSQTELSGGHLSRVARVGNAVRRTAGPWSPAVQALLMHLDHGGLSLAPWPLSLDVEKGVELLSYIEGDVPSGGKKPEYLWRDETLEAVARLVRQFHDATISWQSPPDACWQALAAFPEGGEVICHNDLAPWNTVFDTRGRPTAFVDWDLAAPGPRLWDIAFAIWHFVPLYGETEAGDPFDPAIFDPRGERVRRFCDAYGLNDRGGVVEMIKLRQETTHATFKRRAEAGDPPYVRLWEMGAGDGLTRQTAFLDRHRPNIEAYLK